MTFNTTNWPGSWPTSAVPVIVQAGSVSRSFTVNQRQKPRHGPFATAGTIRLPAGDATIEISNTGTDGHVIIDCIQLLARGQK